MNEVLDMLKSPWHWSVAGVLVGLTVPALLLLGNKHFGISANLRHACAACIPANIPFFKYDWRKERWNFFFIGGTVLGAFLVAQFLQNPNEVTVHPELAASLAEAGITDYSHLVPTQLFNFSNLFTLKGVLFLVFGGFMVGFGSRYAGGCTSGHAISGLSNLQWPSLVATIFFMVGGFISANWLVPFLLHL